MEHNLEISQEEWDSIESYLLQQQTVDEQAAFEKKLSVDPTLRAKLSEIRLLLLGVGEAALHEKLDEFHRTLPSRQKEYRMTSRPSPGKTWLVAASFILFVAIASWLLLQRQNSNSKLFASYFKPDPGLMTAMSATDNYAFDRAMIDYKKGDYQKAIHTWDSLQKLQPANDTLNYFLGVAHLANQNEREAIDYLQKVSASPGSFFRADAFWYLGLTLLKEGKKEEAMAALKQSTHPEKEQLLERLIKD